MRVTNSMLVSNFMNNLHTNANKMNKLQSQLASGRKFAHIEDDPVSVIYSQQARYKLTRLDHYSQNVSTAQEWLTAAESNIRTMNDLIVSAYEACVDVSTDYKVDSDKQNVAAYLGQLRDELVNTLNSSFGDKFLFAGYNTTGQLNSSDPKTMPFTVDANDELCFCGVPINDVNLNDPSTNLEKLRGDVLTFDVGAGIEMPATMSGLDIVLYNLSDNDKNIFSAINDLYKDAKAGADAEQLASHIPNLQAAQSHLLKLTAEIGGRTNRLDILESRYSQDEINYTQMKSDAEDMDFAEVIMNYKMAEAVYNAALSAGASIIQPTLMDFLR